MKKLLLASALAVAGTLSVVAQQPAQPAAPARPARPAPDTTPRPKVVIFYAIGIEYDHLLFEQEAIRFFNSNANKDHYNLVVTTDWDLLNPTYLKDVKVVVWLNDEPHTAAQRDAFQAYMEHGGGWLGFHVSAFNQRNDRNVWFRNFLGGGSFAMNNWPPLPAKVVVDDPNHPVTKGLPATFEAPQNEWYSWSPSPRLNPDVHVLLTLDKSNFPIGIKDVINPTDVPIVWTNTRFNMLYLNIGHGDKILTSTYDTMLMENGLNWLLSK